MNWLLYIALLVLLVVIVTVSCTCTVEGLTDAPSKWGEWGPETCEIDDDNKCTTTKTRQCLADEEWCDANASNGVMKTTCTFCATAIVIKDPIQDCSRPCGGGMGSQDTTTYSWSAGKDGWEPNSDDAAGLVAATKTKRVKCNTEACCPARTVTSRPMNKKGVGLPDFFADARFAKPEDLFRITSSALDGANGINAGWYYNWGYCEEFDTAVQYVPMQYSVRNRPEIRGRSDYLLGINEPDHPCQGKLTIYDVLVPYNRHASMPGVRALRKLLVRQCPTESPPSLAPIQAFQVKTPNPDVSVWSEIEQSAKYIGSPACASENAGFDLPYKELAGTAWDLTEGTGQGWMYRFANYNPAPNFNFMCVHWYANGKTADDMIEYLEHMFSIYKKPIWITEYAPQTTGDSMKDPARYSWAQVNAFITKTTKFFEETPWIHRYAWHHSYVGTSALWTKNGTLTQTGIAYRDADRVYRKNSPALEIRHKAVYDSFGTRYATSGF